MRKSVARSTIQGLLTALILLFTCHGTVLATEARVGAYVTGLRDLNMRDKTFDADIWLWAITPSGVTSPLKTMEYTNSKQVRTSYESSQTIDGKAWHQIKASGTFYQHWDLSRFPFDRQVLLIRVEESLSDETALTYVVDTPNSSISKQLVVDGWAITDFKIRGASFTYNSTYGDPRLDPGASSHYPGLIMEITMARKEMMSFVLLAMPVYVAVMVSFLTFFMSLENSSLNSPRYSMIAGSLFLIIINLRAASDQIGASSGVGLIQAIHLLAMVSVLLITTVVIRGQIRMEKGVAVDVIAADCRKIAITLACLFILINVGMIAMAAFG